MNEVTIFQFETHPIRALLIEDQPWFIAADVAAVLEYRNAPDLTRLLDNDERGTQIVRTPRGEQAMTVISEAGLYSAILRSRKTGARRFKKWVTSEVLPAIRQTGSYARPGPMAARPAPIQDKIGALLLIGEAMTQVPGVTCSVAMAATLTAIHENTGMSIEALRQALPSAEGSAGDLHPTQLGERLDLPARTVNLRLQSLGFQFKNDADEWELTETGQAWAKAPSDDGQTGDPILWKSEVIDLRQAAG